MSGSDLDVQRRRAGENQALFRTVNYRIDELNRRFGSSEVSRFVCECLEPACVELIAIPHDEFERIRRNPTEFFVIPGHEVPQVEEVVHRDERWLVVRKLGVGAKVAAELAES